MKMLIILNFCLLSTSFAFDFVSQVKQSFDYRCEPGMHISRIVNDIKEEDEIWQFSCGTGKHSKFWLRKELEKD